MMGTSERGVAQASDLGQTCDTGISIVENCAADLGPPTAGPISCEVTDFLNEDGDGCYSLTPKIGGDTCPAGTTPSPNAQTCRLPVETVTQTIASVPPCPDFYESQAELFGVCARVVPASQSGATCPAGARGPAGDCYLIVPVEAFCFAGVLVGENCVFEGSPPVNGTCSIGFGFVAGRCVRFSVPEFGGCPATTTVDTFGQCREPVADRVDTYSCLDGAAELVGTDCVVTVAPLDCSYNEAVIGCGFEDPQCPDGFASDPVLGGLCARFETASQLPASCPAGSRGSAGGCYILVAKGPVGVSASDQCSVGELVGNTCVITGDPPVSGPDGLLCSTGFGLVGETCVRYATPVFAFPECPVGSLEDTAGFCRKPVSDAAGAFFCEDPTAALQGTSCVLVTGFVTFCAAVEVCDVTCPDGFVLGGNELCIRTAPAVVTASECPINAFGTAGACFRTYQASPCRAGAVAIADGLCAFDVDDAMGSFYCEDPTGMLQDSGLQDPMCQVTAPFSSDCSAADALAGLCGQAEIGCPFGFSIDDSLGALCARFEPADQSTGEPRLVCPDGALGDPGACYILVPALPAEPSFCNRGNLVGSTCVVIGDPPTGNPLVCANEPFAFFQFSVVEGQCVLTEPEIIPFPQCPLNSVEDPFGGCRQPVASITVDPGPDDAPVGELFCADPTAFLNGIFCVFTVTPSVVCNRASFACGAGEEVTITVCPVSGEEVTAADECYSVEPLDGAVCPDGLAMDPVQMTMCRLPVDSVPGLAVCQSGSLIDGRCLVIAVETQPSELDCAGADAALCDNVVESDQAVPGEDLVSLRPTTIDYYQCAGGVADFAVIDSQGATVASGALTETAAGVYQGEYEVPSSGVYSLQVSIECPDGTTETATDTLVFIDPSGFILDCAGDIVVGAVVTLSRATTATGTLSVVADGDATIMDPTVNVSNPSISDDNGRYRWDVVAGFYQVTASVDGQPSVSSAVLEVPPARTDVDLTFTALNCVEPGPEATAEPTPTPTAVVNPVVRRAAPVSAPDAAAAAVSDVRLPVSSTVTQQVPLAVTGTETSAPVLAGMLAIAVGTSLIGAERVRRKRID